MKVLAWMLALATSSHVFTAAAEKPETESENLTNTATRAFHALQAGSPSEFNRYLAADALIVTLRSASLNLSDDWKARRLGPASSAKIASNAFGYLYYRKEAGRWIIWKLEYVRH